MITFDPRHLIINTTEDYWRGENYLFGRRDGSSHVVRVQIAAGDAVHQLHQVAVTDLVERRGHRQVGAFGPFDDPPIVDVLVVVAGDLLLVRRASLVGILDRIFVGVTVQPAGLAVTVAQRHLRTVHHLQRLAAKDRIQTTL